jgi:hypothetical protein
MPRKKKVETPSILPPPASARPITCAFCQKELAPLTDAVTFVGWGKWRDGPAHFNAACSTSTPEQVENPCLKSAVAWVTAHMRQQPVLMTYDEWRARPIRRHVYASRMGNGRYSLQLVESHLNCFFFLEDKRVANSTKAAELAAKWQADWDISATDMPDIAGMEEEARRKPDPSLLQTSVVDQKIEQLERQRGEVPEELKAEISRHAKTYTRHLKKNHWNDVDECKSCKICRGIKKLYVQSEWIPLMDIHLAMLEEIALFPIAPSYLTGDFRKSFEKIVRTICETLDIKDGDDKHNDAAKKRNAAEIKLARAMVDKYRKPPQSTN